MIAVHLLVLVLGGAVLVKCADWMVEYAARLARRFGMSDLLIGLTLTSIGTSVPELAASVSATLQGNPTLALGNVMGSNIANIGLILGVAALVRPIATDQTMHERDGFVMFAAALLLFGLASNNQLGRADALLLLVLYAAYLGLLVRTDRGGIDHRFRGFVDFAVDAASTRQLRDWARGRRDRRSAEPPTRAPQPATPPPSDETVEEAAPEGRVTWEVAVVVLSCVGVMLGARYFTAEAAWVARWAGLPEAIIGLSLVALGTSLPELTVAVSAARRGKAGMVVGNVMGSNIANVLLVLGICGGIQPIPVSELSVVYTLPIVLFFSLGLLYLVRSSWKITRLQGGAAVLAYGAFLALAFVQGWS